MAGAVAALALIWGIRADARRDAERDAKIRAAEAAEQRRKDIQDAIENSHAGGAADNWRSRLRDHG